MTDPAAICPNCFHSFFCIEPQLFEALIARSPFAVDRGGAE